MGLGLKFDVFMCFVCTYFGLFNLVSINPSGRMYRRSSHMAALSYPPSVVTELKVLDRALNTAFS